MREFKLCSSCKVSKTRDEFYPDRRKKRLPNSLRSVCKKCDIKAARMVAIRNPEKTKQNMRRWRLFHYKMTVNDFNNKLISQNNKCAICLTDKPGGIHKQWHVDHDHECCNGKDTCGKCTRGILCRPCNQALGLVNDNKDILLKMINYLNYYGK